MIFRPIFVTIGAMNTALRTFNSLKVYERLKSAELPESAAREISDILLERDEYLQTELATKKDLDEKLEKLKMELSYKSEKNSTNLIKWMIGALIAQGGLIVAMIQLLG